MASSPTASSQVDRGHLSLGGPMWLPQQGRGHLASTAAATICEAPLMVVATALGSSGGLSIA